MNANELADELAFKHIAGDDSGAFSSKIITMLRQQQAEIKALKKLVSEMKYEKSSGVYEMNNEPVAWMDEINTFVLDKDYKQFPKSLQNGMIPLYTHPVKELTDEEIIRVYEKMLGFVSTEKCAINFARALLKKAQEK